MADPATPHLERLRAHFDAMGSDAWDAAEPVPADLLGQIPSDDDLPAQARFYELMAYDALALERPGWAFVCLRASGVAMATAGQPESAAALHRRAQRVLEASYPPYASQDEHQADLQRWLWARTLELARPPDVPALAARREGPLQDRPAPLSSEALPLKHRWMFRLLRGFQVDRAFRVDGLFRRLGLPNKDQVLLRVLWGAHGDRVFEHLRREAGATAPMTVGFLADLVADDAHQRHTWLDRFDGRAPLRALGLVWVEGGPPERPLDDRRVAIDESMLAAIEGRDFWPGEAPGLGLHRASGHDEAAAATAEALRALDDGPVRHLITDSARAAIDVVAAWSARESSGEVIAIEGTALRDPGLRRLAARQARLRDAKVLALAPHRPDDLTSLAALLSGPLVAQQVEGDLGVAHAPPTGGDAELAWNTALGEAGLAELAPAEVREHLVPLGIHATEMRAVTRLARAHGPRVGAAALADLARRALRGERG